VLHNRHIQFLEKAKAEGGYLVVALEPDESITKYKKTPTRSHTETSAYNLAGLRYVDKVLVLPKLNGFKDYNQLVHDVEPDKIAITADDPQKQIKSNQAIQVGADLKVVVGRIKNYSSTKIVSYGLTHPR